MKKRKPVKGRPPKVAPIQVKDRGRPKPPRRKPPRAPSLAWQLDQLTVRLADLTKFTTHQVRTLLTRIDALQGQANDLDERMENANVTTDHYRLSKKVDQLERAQGYLTDRLKIIENTRPAWAKDHRGNPLPVYTMPTEGSDK